MSIDLSSRLSAFTTDFAGVNHVVWVEDGAIWHASYDATSGTWVNAQLVVAGVTGNVTALNLVANPELIGKASSATPGLVVVWQDGVIKNNGSNFFYSAAQYNTDGELQWAANPTALTVNESSSGLPFANLAPSIVTDNLGNVIVVGQQVNVLNAANQAIREDTDLYSSIFKVSSVTPAAPGSPSNAFYTPPTIVDGVNQGPGIPIGQAPVAQTTSMPSTLSKDNHAETSSTAVAMATPETTDDSNDSSFEGLGFQFGPSISFGTELLEALGLDEYLKGIPLATLKKNLEKYEIVGTISGSTNFDNDIQLLSEGEAVRNRIVTPREIDQVTRLVKKSNPKKSGQSISFSFDSKTLYQNSYPYYLKSIEDTLSLTARQTVVIFDNEEAGGVDRGKITLTGSAGIGAILTMEPEDPSGSKNLMQIGLEDGFVDAGSALITFFAAKLAGSSVAASLIAGGVFDPLANILIGTLTDRDNLKVTDYLMGPTVGATLDGEFYSIVAPMIKLILSGGVTVLYGAGSEPNSNTTVLGIPVSAGVSYGPFELNITIEPRWKWPSNPPLDNNTESTPMAAVSSAMTMATAIAAGTEAQPPTATVAGNLLTLNFDSPLLVNDNSAIPETTDFTINTQNQDQSQAALFAGSVGGVLVSNDATTGNGVVVLQLTQPIPYSPQFTGTNPQPNGDLSVFVSYTGTALQFSDTTKVPSITNLTVNNNSPQSLAVAFNPTSGNGNNYTINSLTLQTNLLSGLQADYAQDSPPALTLIGQTSIAQSQVLAVWSREVQPLTPIAGFVNGNQAYLNFVQELNTSPTISNDQFSLTVSSASGSRDVTVTNVSIGSGGFIQLNLSSAVTSDESVQISYAPDGKNYVQNLYLTDAVSSKLWVPAFTESLVNTTVDISGSTTQSVAPIPLGGSVIVNNITSNVAGQTSSSPSNLVSIIFNGLLNTSSIPDGSSFMVVNNGQQYTGTIEDVTVTGNVVTFNLPAVGEIPLISQGDITTVTYTPQLTADKNLYGAGSNGAAVLTFTTPFLTTLPESPTTTLMAGFYTPGGQPSLSNFQNIPGSTNLNFDPAVASDPSGNALAVWVYADISNNSIDYLDLPGQFYNNDDSQIIWNSLSQSDIYFSYWNGSQWTQSAPLIVDQIGTDKNVTVGYSSTTGSYIAAWLNNNQGQTLIYWASYNPLNNTWSQVNTILNAPIPDISTDLVLSSINGEPALFWTSTQAVSYSQYTTEENPPIYLRLGEQAGSTAKNSGNLGYTADGTYTGSFSLGQQGALYDSSNKSGDPNSAVLFENGASLTLNSPLNISGSSFSVEFWFKIPDQVSSPTTLVDVDSVFSMVINSDGTLTFALDDPSGSSINTGSAPAPTSISEDSWHYVVGTYSNQTELLSLYIDGAQVQTLTDISFDLPSSATLTLAGDTDPVYLDEVALYESVLGYVQQPVAGPEYTGLDMLNSIFSVDNIGTKYQAQYVNPLPPGPQTHYSILSNQDSGLTWSEAHKITVIPAIEPTQLNDANIPTFDVVSNAGYNGTGNISPNGQEDTLFEASIIGQQGNVISGISLVLSNNLTYSVGTDGSGNLLAGNQLGVIIGDKLVNSSSPNAIFSAPVMASSLTLDLLVDTTGAPSITASKFTVYFRNNSQPPYVVPSRSLPTGLLPQYIPADSVSSTLGENTPVIGVATVTEVEDSSLTLIDSGFIVETSNPGMGYALISADFNGDGKSDVAVGNRGYVDGSGQVLNQGTVQILMGGSGILEDDASGALAPPTVNDLSSATSGNPGGFSIVGIPDGGSANGDSPLSLATGDLDGDGYAELVIGSPNNGNVYVVNGSYLASSSAKTVINVQDISGVQGYVITDPSGNTSLNQFGFAVAVGNFTDASGAEIAIGAPNAFNGNGAVYLSSKASSKPTLFYTGQSYTDPLTNDVTGEQAGYALSASTSVKGGPIGFGVGAKSTIDTLIVGAPNHVLPVTNSWTGIEGLPTNSPNPYPKTTPVNVGAVYVFTGSGNGLNSTASLTYLGTDVNTPSSNGAAQSLYAGSELASNGDWNGDGYVDLAIGAPAANSNAGAVYVLSGKPPLSSTSPQYLNQTSNLILNGGLPLGQAGAVVNSAGDVNDDGYDDLLITAAQAANGIGQGYVMFGASGLLGPGGNTVQLLSPVASDTKTSFILNGNFPYQLTGQVAAPIGDINGDKVDDLMVTAPNAYQLYAVYGHPWLADDGSIKLADISGDNGFVTDGNLYTAQGTILSGTGNNVVMLGDINGDGFDDVLAGGSAFGAIVSFGASTLDLLDAATGSDQLIITMADSGRIRSVFSAGDFNGDGLSDIGVLDQNNYFYLITGSEDLGSQQLISLASDSPNRLTGIQSAAAAGDYNGDGYDDLLLTTSSATSLYLGDAAGSLANPISFDAANNRVLISVGDVNGDGLDDIGGGDPSANGSATLYFGDSTPQAGNQLNLSPPSAVLRGNLTNNSWQTPTLWGQYQTKFNGSPSLAVFNDRLYMAYTGVNNSSSNGSLYMQMSEDGVNWQGSTSFSGLYQAGTGYAIATFNDELYAAYVDTSQHLNIATAATTSSNPLGLEFSSSQNFNTNYAVSYVTPAITAYNNKLYVFFATGNQNASQIGYYYSSDGTTWTRVDSINSSSNYGVLPLGSGLAVTSDESSLYLSYATPGANSSTNLVFATLTGSEWVFNDINQSVLRGAGLVEVGNTFYDFYLPANTSNQIDFVSSSGGTNWGQSSTVPISNQYYWFTNANAVYFRESIALAYGVQQSKNFNVDVSYIISDPVYQPNITQQFGNQLRDIGDFNGDGIGDFAILAPGYYSNLSQWNNGQLENNLGAVLIYFGGPALGSNSSPDLVLGTPAPTGSTNVALNQAYLVREFAPTGDVNGDGFDDLILASPSTALDSNNTADGVAFVVFGGGESLWGVESAPLYPASRPFDLGLLSTNTSTLTLDFATQLNPASLPATSSFTVQNGFTSVGVSRVAFSTNSHQLILTLSGNVDTSEYLSVSYVQPTSGSALTYASGGLVAGFTASNDSVVATAGAPTIPIPSYAQYGFQIAGLPNSQSGISLDGGGDVNGDGFSDFIIGSPGSNDNLAYTIFGSDFNRTVSQTGTIGNDIMKGSPTGESFVANQGDDLIVSGGGVDVVYAGPGDDQLIVNDVYFQRMDGGSGTDALFLQGYNGQDWDLTALSPGIRLQDLEILVTQDYGANTLTLNSLSVMQMSSNNSVTVFQDSSDDLVLSSDFAYVGIAYQYGQNFSEYQSSISAARVLSNQPYSSKTVSFTASSKNTPSPILPNAASAAEASPMLMASTFPAESTGNVTTRSALADTSDSFAVADASAVDSVSALDSDTPTKIYVSNPTVSELSGRAEFTLTRSGNLDKYLRLEYYTEDGSGKAGKRYLPVAGSLLFAPGEATRVVNVPIPNNGQYVGDRHFSLVVSLVEESLDKQGIFPLDWSLLADPKGEQLRLWNYRSEITNGGLWGGILEFDTTTIDGAAMVDISAEGIREFNTFYSTSPESGVFEELLFNGRSGAIFKQGLTERTRSIQIIFQDGEAGDADGVVNGLGRLEGYPGVTIPGLFTTNQKTFWAPTSADGQIQSRLLRRPDESYEFGWLKVDGVNGQIVDGDSIVNPGDSGYETLLLARLSNPDYRVVMSQDNDQASSKSLNPSIAQSSLVDGRELQSTEHQFFGGLADVRLSQNQYYVLFATKDGQTTFSSLETPSLSNDSRGYYQLDFAGLTTELVSQAITVPGRLNQQVVVQASLSRAAAFENFLALYQVDNLSGGIDTDGDLLIDFQPGDVGYAAAALTRAKDALTGITLQTPQNFSSSHQTIELLGSGIYGVVLIPNSNIDEVLAKNPENNLSQANVAFFSFSAANPDGISHMSRLGDNLFGFEDKIGGGDKDYNDLVMALSFGS